MWHYSHFRMYWWGLKTVRPLPLHRYFLSINHHSSNQPKTLNGSKWHKNPKALNPCQLTKILSKTKEFIFIFSICASVSRYTTKLCTTWLPSLLKHWNQALPNNIRVTVKNNTTFLDISWRGIKKRWFSTHNSACLFWHKIYNAVLFMLLLAIYPAQ